MMPNTEASQSTTPHRPNRNSSAKGRGEESRRESGRALMTTPSAAWCSKTTGVVGKTTRKGCTLGASHRTAPHRTAACVIYDPHKACLNAWSPWNMHLLRKKCKRSCTPKTYQQVPYTKRRVPCVCARRCFSARAETKPPRGTFFRYSCACYTLCNFGLPQSNNPSQIWHFCWHFRLAWQTQGLRVLLRP